MTFSVSTRPAPGVTGRDATLYVLEDGQGGTAEVWPALGFNCFRWRAVRGGEALEVLYHDPALFDNGRPTRSGVPVLFPFPNRIRDGRFTWAGKEYRLPLNDPAQKNAIHGFACRNAFRVASHGADAASAHVTGVFRCSVDAPDCLPLWPADHEIRLTLRLGQGVLRFEAEVHNPDAAPLPFGLGYHPYFRLPSAGAGPAADCEVEAPAEAYWVLDESLPTGERRPVDAGRDLNAPRKVGGLQLDDVLSVLPAGAPRADGLLGRGAVHAAPGGPMRLFCAPEFRELVVFTPPHRQAFCIEPYTCPTDAVNLQARGIEANWLVLPPGQTWSAVVELRV